MKIAIIGLLKGFNTPVTGGPERVVKNMIKGIVKYDKENDYLIFLIGFKEKTLVRKLAPNVKLYPIAYELSELSEIIKHSRIRSVICNVIIDEQPDVTIAHDPSYVYFLPKSVLKKTIVILHGAFWEGVEYQYQRINMLPRLLYRKFVYIPLSFLALKKSRLLIAVTEYLKSKLPRDLEAKTIVMENPVDDVFFELLKYRNKEKYFDNERIHILTVGRYDPRKNYEVLLYAIKRLIERNSKYKSKILVKIIGSEYKSFSWYLSRIENLVQKLGLNDNVMLIKNQSDKNLLMHYLQSDIYVHPSLYEGLPNAIQEAMALGLPVIASKVGGIPHVIKHGHNGFLFDPMKIEDLAKILEMLIERPSLRELIGRMAHETAMYRWSLQRYILKLGAVAKVFDV